MLGLLSNRLGVPLFLMRVFRLKELHMLTRGHGNGLSSCRSGSRLGCHLGSRFGCMLGGFGTRFGSFGGRLGSSFRFCPFNTQSRHGSHWVFIHTIVGVQGPCFHCHLPNPIRHEQPLPTQSQCRTHCHCLLQHHLGDYYQQMLAMTHQNLLQSVRHGMTALTLTLKYQSHHCHFPMNLLVPIHHAHSLPTQSQCLMHCPISGRKPSTCYRS